MTRRGLFNTNQRLSLPFTELIPSRSRDPDDFTMILAVFSNFKGISNDDRLPVRRIHLWPLVTPRSAERSLDGKRGVSRVTEESSCRQRFRCRIPKTFTNSKNLLHGRRGVFNACCDFIAAVGYDICHHTRRLSITVHRGYMYVCMYVWMDGWMDGWLDVCNVT